MRRLLKLVVTALVLFLIGAQFMQPDRTNPPLSAAATFEAIVQPGPATAGVFQRACYDCHSNTTIWPWYSRIAPVSWLLVDDVREGRSHLNFSQWANYGREVAVEKLKDACEEVKSGGMPLWIYRIMHAKARLSDEDIRIVCGAADQLGRSGAQGESPQMPH